MTAAIAVTVAVAVLAVSTLLIVRTRSRARATERARAAALERLAEAMERVADELDAAISRAESAPRIRLTAGEPHPPTIDPASGLPTRTAFLDELARLVGAAHTDGHRLALALLRVEAQGTGLDRAVGRVADAARTCAAEARLFRAGQRELALLLPRSGRADAFAAIARIEATLDADPAIVSQATELEAGEDAIAFLTRTATGDPD